MEPFLVYVILCFAASGGCLDYGPKKPFAFKNKKDCIAFAYNLLETGRIHAEKGGLIYVDGKAFCLRFTESRET